MADDINPLSMSDDDFDAMPWESEQQDTQEEEALPDAAEESAGEAVADDLEEGEEDSTQPEEEASDDSDEPVEEEEEADDKGEEDSDESEEPEEPATDYEAEYKKLLAPFKANGKDMQVETVDDAIQLMKMGAGFNKKMSALKPNFKLIKMLENNDLLSEEKLSFLIDLDKKDPSAVKKLVKDSNIDEFDLNDESGEVYKPKTYTVDDRELELDNALADIRDTAEYTKTVDVVTTKWDDASRKTIVENPGVIRLINEHMGNGLYDQIQAEIDKERTYGRLSGLSDIEAYRQTGDKLNAAGKFNTAPAQPTPVQPTKTKPDPKLTQRKRAAAPTKSTKSGASNNPSDKNPLSMSDEEFEKEFADKFL